MQYGDLEDLIVVQVPLTTYLIIGGGRLALHLAFYFQAKGLSFKSWNRKEHSQGFLQENLDCDFVLLCLPDDQILSFWQSIGFKKAVHFSGCFFHPEIRGFHPLMTFGLEVYELGVYESIPFVGVHDEEVFRETFPEWTNCYVKIKKQQQAMYHGLCVLAGNGTTLLWDLVTQNFNQIGIDHHHLKPYLQRIFENISHQSQGRWSGPWYRKDQKTIERNKNALSGQLQELYENFFKLSKQAKHFHG